MRCTFDKTQLGAWEQAGEVTAEVRAEVLVELAERQRDRHIQTGKLSRRDLLVLPFELGEEGSGPAPYGNESVGGVGVAEELEQDGDGFDPAGSSSSLPNRRAVCWRSHRRWSRSATSASANGAKCASANSRIISGGRSIGAWP